MRVVRGVRFGWLLGLCVSSLVAPARAESWVAALSELRAAPSAKSDAALSPAERIAAARMLGGYGPAHEAIPALLAALDQKPAPALREEILFALARRAAPSAEPRLLALLANDSPVSPALAAALAAIGSDTAWTALVAALARDPAQVIERALISAGRPATRALVAALRGPNAVQAARVLGRLGAEADRVAEPALARALSSESSELRAAAATALGQLGRADSGAALLARVHDPDVKVVEAALIALARTAMRPQAPALLAAYERGSAAKPALNGGAAKPALVLRALVHADPALATSALASALRASDAELRASAREAIEAVLAPDPLWVPLLAQMLASDLSEASASALARVPVGRGMSALIAVAGRTPDAAQRCARAIALGLRRFADELDQALVQRARALLHSLPPGERRLLLCSLARDGAALRFAIEGLSAADPGRRAAAAYAVALLGDARAASALSVALVREQDPEAVRRMIDAAVEFGLAPPPTALRRWLSDRETAYDAMQFVAHNARGAASDELRVLLRALLATAEEARSRAGAALALGQLEDARAVPALEAALADASPRVRLAAVRALAALSGKGAGAALRAHARLERDPLVRAAARETAARGGRPLALSPRGTQALEVRLVARGAAEPRPLLDVLLRDGRWLRMRAQAGSELIVTDLPEGSAEVRVLD